MSFDSLNQPDIGKHYDLYAKSLTIGDETLTRDRMLKWDLPGATGYGQDGKDGESFSIALSVPTYSSLPLGGYKESQGIYVEDTGKLYMYNNGVRPDEDKGIQMKGDKGDSIKGEKGDKGDSIKGDTGSTFEIRVVPTYSSLPTIDVIEGRGGLTQDTGMLYIYHNGVWPSEDKGVKIRGENGSKGEPGDTMEAISSFSSEMFNVYDPTTLRRASYDVTDLTADVKMKLYNVNISLGERNIPLLLKTDALYLPSTMLTSNNTNNEGNEYFNVSYNRYTGKLGMNDKYHFNRKVAIEGQWLDGKLVKLLQGLEDSQDNSSSGGSVVSSIFGFVGGAAGIISSVVGGATTFKALATSTALDTLDSVMRGNFQNIFTQLDSLTSQIPQITSDVADIGAITNSLNDYVNTISDVVSEQGVKINQVNDVLNTISMDHEGYLYNSNAFIESAFGQNFTTQTLVEYLFNTPVTQAYNAGGDTVTSPTGNVVISVRSNYDPTSSRYWMDGKEVGSYGFDKAVTQKLVLKKFATDVDDVTKKVTITDVDTAELTVDKIKKLDTLNESYSKTEVFNMVSEAEYKTALVNNKVDYVTNYASTVNGKLDNVIANKNVFTGGLWFGNVQITQDNFTKLYTLLTNNMLDSQTLILKDVNGYGQTLNGNTIYNLNQMSSYNGSSLNDLVTIDGNGMLGKRKARVTLNNSTELTVGDTNTTKVYANGIYNNSNNTQNSKHVMISPNGELTTTSSLDVSPSPNVITLKYFSSFGWGNTYKMAGVHRAEDFIVFIDHDWQAYKTYNLFMFCIPITNYNYIPYYNADLHVENNSVNPYAIETLIHVSKPTLWNDTAAEKSYYVYRCFMKSTTTFSLNGCHIVFKCSLLPSTLTGSIFEFGALGSYTKDAPFWAI